MDKINVQKRKAENTFERFFIENDITEKFYQNNNSFFVILKDNKKINSSLISVLSKRCFFKLFFNILFPDLVFFKLFFNIYYFGSPTKV
jgi:hypothetical protein